MVGAMKHLVPLALWLVALLHALPLAGVLGAARLSTLYGIDVADPNLALLLRHRAVLFGLLAALLAALEGPLNGAVMSVVWLDIAALILLLAAGIVHLLPTPTP